MAGDPIAEKAAASILKRAVELDTSKRFTEALVCYQEGLQLLMEAVKAKGLLSFNFQWIYVSSLLYLKPLKFRAGRKPKSGAQEAGRKLHEPSRIYKKICRERERSWEISRENRNMRQFQGKQLQKDSWKVFGWICYQSSYWRSVRQKCSSGN